MVNGYGITAMINDKWLVINEQLLISLLRSGVQTLFAQGGCRSFTINHLSLTIRC